MTLRGILGTRLDSRALDIQSRLISLLKGKINIPGRERFSSFMGMEPKGRGPCVRHTML